MQEEQDEARPLTPGQFHYPPTIHATRSYESQLWYRYRREASIIGGILLTLCISILCFSAVLANGNTAPIDPDAHLLTVTPYIQPTHPFSIYIPTITPTLLPTQTAVVSLPTRIIAPTPGISPTAQPVPAPTASPAPTRTPLPSPTPTSTPTPGPTPTPTSVPLYVTFSAASATELVNATVSVNTLPKATLRIQVIWCTGKIVSNAALKGSFLADAAGNYSWTWVPKSLCTGQATATVTANLNGQTVKNSTVFQVQ